MPTLSLKKNKNHNCSTFKTYLQYQDFNLLQGFFGFAVTFSKLICWYDSAGRSKSSIFGKGLASVFDKFVPSTLDAGSAMVQYNCEQFPKEPQILD